MHRGRRSGGTQYAKVVPGLYIENPAGYLRVAEKGDFVGSDGRVRDGRLGALWVPLGGRTERVQRAPGRVGTGELQSN